MLSITHKRSATAEEWDRIWNSCPSATYFHSREWAEFWNHYSRGDINPHPLLLSFSDDASALLPLSSQRTHRGLMKSYLSSPAGTYGGWIASGRLGAVHAHLLMQFLSELGNISWRVNPYEPLTPPLPSVARADQTFVLDLRLGFDELHSRWTKGHSSAARKAKREGVSVRPAEDAEAWRAYYTVYQSSMLRWGNLAISRYDWRLFEEMSRRNSPNVQLWVADYQGQIVAGVLMLYSRRHAVYWHGAALDQYFHLRPVNLLMAEVIKNACDRGLLWFDFNPSGGHEGVTAFKKSFGAVPLESPVINLHTPAYDVLRRVGILAHRLGI